jgi:hypothetical protein
MYPFKQKTVIVLGFANTRWFRVDLMRTIREQFYKPILGRLHHAAITRNFANVMEEASGLVVNLDRNNPQPIFSALVAGHIAAESKRKSRKWMYGMLSDERVSLDHIPPFMHHIIRQSGGATFRKPVQLPKELYAYRGPLADQYDIVQLDNPPRIFVGGDFGYYEPEHHLLQSLHRRIEQAQNAGFNLKLTFESELGSNRDPAVRAKAVIDAVLRSRTVVIVVTPTQPWTVAVAGFALARHKRVIVYSADKYPDVEDVRHCGGQVVHSPYALFRLLRTFHPQLADRKLRRVKQESSPPSPPPEGGQPKTEPHAAAAA